MDDDDDDDPFAISTGRPKEEQRAFDSLWGNNNKNNIKPHYDSNHDPLEQRVKRRRYQLTR